MTNPRLKNYLRTYRKHAGLTQDQMAYLLGAEDGSKVSRYERSIRLPGLKTALALQAVTNTPVHELFAGMYQEIKSQVDFRARKLARQITAAMDKKKESNPSQQDDE